MPDVSGKVTSTAAVLVGYPGAEATPSTTVRTTRATTLKEIPRLSRIASSSSLTLCQKTVLYHASHIIATEKDCDRSTLPTGRTAVARRRLESVPGLFNELGEFQRRTIFQVRADRLQAQGQPRLMQSPRKRG